MTRKLLLVAALSCFPWSAWAHGDAEWIMKDPKYLAQNGAHCCNIHDCGVAPAGAAVPVPGGWQVIETGQVFTWGERGLYPSNDGITLWWCRPGNRPVRCLFVPGQGS
ncbi:MAG: hypothetical protein FJX35_08015 [Alphaproteobacteria bacterium]|nr:hypothetical protein [Alphaproteobacteria bacterium]